MAQPQGMKQWNVELGDNRREAIRWRIALQFLLWGAKIAPAGTDRGDLIEVLLDWCMRARAAALVRRRGKP